MVSMDPYLPVIVLIGSITLLIAFILQWFKQPSVVAYILAGVAIGPQGLGVITDVDLVTHLGNIGVVLLLFFVGMEISLKKLFDNWKIAVVGQVLQVVLSVGCVALFGYGLQWPLSRILLLGFVISLSSTAVLVKLLEKNNWLDKKIGHDIFGILIVQDLAVVPMMIILSSFSEQIGLPQIALQVLGLLGMVIFIAWIYHQQSVRLPFKAHFQKDPELQFLGVFVICFGFALITGLLGISTALGAFMAGIVIASTKETRVAHESLHSFKMLFVALFFMAVGMLIDVAFLKENMWHILFFVVAVLLTNTFINAAILRFLKRSWRYSLYAGAMLSQIGEFSFVLVSVGFHAGIVAIYGYQMVISVIALSLLVSPLWIRLFSSFEKSVSG